MTANDPVFFKQAALEHLADIIRNRFTGYQITGLFEKSGHPEIRHDGTTKKLFVYQSLEKMQRQDNTYGIIRFLETACDPIEYARHPEGNEGIVQDLNMVLRFYSLKMTEGGKIINDNKTQNMSNQEKDNAKILTGNFGNEEGSNSNFTSRKPTSVFVSHSNKDNTMANEIESSINKLYLELFLAHRDIEGGEEWREVIRGKIRDCNVFVALVTPDFHESEYTEQEVGAAWLLKKPILSIRVDGTDPKGFITGKQWITYNKQYPHTTAGELVKFALTEMDGHDRMVDVVVEILNNARSFNESNYLADILSSQTVLTPKQITGIKHALETNDQVYGARYTKKQLSSILGKHSE